MNAVTEEIIRLKQEKNVLLLCHIYQIPEIQDLADYVGDSLGLSRKASEAECDIILFCGVRFMAETAAILNPDKKVLIPDEGAGCPMADMIIPEKLQELKDEYPGVPVACYVNSTAETKALSDICVTSANALTVINKLPDKKIIFVPDKYLGLYVQRNTDKEIILWDGYCPVHVKISPQDIDEEKKEHPETVVMVHPECIPEVQDLADYVLSTGQMCDKAGEVEDREFIIGTETGIVYTLKKQYPDKVFYPVAAGAVCPNMKKITLEKVLRSLKEELFEVRVEPSVSEQAEHSIIRMLHMS